MVTITTADYVIIAVYMVLMVAVGVYFFRFISDIRGYYTGDNQIPWWVAGISFYMSIFSTYIFVAYAGRAYQWGFPAITMLWSVAPALFIAGLAFARFWRRAGILTPLEFLETRYSFGVRQLFVWARMPIEFINNGARVFALAFFVDTATGIGLDTCILVCGLITLSYTLLGGLWAVTVTDVVQFIVLLGITAVLAPMSLHAAGGWNELAASLPPGHLRPFNQHMPPGFWIAFLAVMIVSFNSNWVLIQRFLCVRDERAARRVGLLGGVLYIFTMPLFMIPCIAAVVLVPGLQHTDQAFVGVAMKVLPPGMVGMVLAAMFAATMSALDSEYNVIASVLTRDVYQRLLRPGASPRELLNVGRAATALAGLTPIAVAFVLIKKHGLFDTILATFGITGGPMAVPLLAGIVYRRGTSWGAVSSMLAGMAVGGTLKFFANAPYDSYQWYSLGSIGTTLCVFLIVSQLTQPDDAKRRAIADFFDRLSRPVIPPPPRGQDGPSPFGIVGLATLCLGVILCLLSLFNRWPGDGLPCVVLGGGFAAAGMGLVRAGNHERRKK